MPAFGFDGIFVHGAAPENILDVELTVDVQLRDFSQQFGQGSGIPAADVGLLLFGARLRPKHKIEVRRIH